MVELNGCDPRPVKVLGKGYGTCTHDVMYCHVHVYVSTFIFRDWLEYYQKPMKTDIWSAEHPYADKPAQFLDWKNCSSIEIIFLFLLEGIVHVNNLANKVTLNCMTILYTL